MPSREEWIAVVERIRGARVPARSPELNQLHRLAMEEARFSLLRMAWVNPPDVEDLVQDKLFEELQAVLDAKDPRAFFRTIVKRAALDLRRELEGKRNRDGTPARSFVPYEVRGEESTLHLRAPDGSAEEELERRQQATLLQAKLSERERLIFEGLRQGEDRDELARILGLNRNNFDQIVSRARRRLGGEP